jgi:hypothetical protein
MTEPTTTKLQRFTVTADVLLILDLEAGSPAEALEHYQDLRRRRPELHGRGGVTVFLPADFPAVVTTDSGKVALQVKAVGASEGRKPSRFNPVGQRRQDQGGAEKSPAYPLTDKTRRHTMTGERTSRP